MLTTAELQDLLDKYLGDRMTESERLRFKEMLSDPNNNRQLSAIVEAVLQQRRYSETHNFNKDELFKQIIPPEVAQEAIPEVPRIPFFRSGWFRYAAAILLMVGVGAYIWSLNNKQDTREVASTKEIPATDVLPGGNKAVLSLADGTTIVLDSAGNGTLARQGNVSIVKLNNGEIVYNATGVATNEVLMNTMITPKGGQYQLTLPDGSKVWLNAASSIVYPTAFNGNERKVKVTGEVYFEVKSNRKQPFIVDVDGKSLVEVLGTRFNINSYADEKAIKTTLLEGSVKIVASSQKAMLRPGQQAQVNTGKIDVLSDIEIEQVMAWKNGLFNFNGADLSTVLHQLERWYDIQTKFESNVPKIIFKGEMDRNVNLSDVLEFFTETGVRFRLEEKTLIIL